MNGWRSQIGPELERNAGVFGVVVAKSFNDPTSIRKHLEAGIEKVPDAVWVMREKQGQKDHAAEFAWQTFKAHGITPFVVPLLPYWQSKGLVLEGPGTGPVEDEDGKRSQGDYPIGRLYDYDLRADWRDITIRSTCERVVVFHDKGSGVTANWLTYVDNPLSQAKIMVVQRGKAKSKHRKGKAPD